LARCIRPKRIPRSKRFGVIFAFFILDSFCFVVYTISMQIRLQSIQLNDRLVRVRAHVNIVFDNWFSFYVPTARRNDIGRAVSFFDPVLPDERQDHGGDFVFPKRCKGFCYRNKP
jgi:hypothetical protein